MPDPQSDANCHTDVILLCCSLCRAVCSCICFWHSPNACHGLTLGAKHMLKVSKRSQARTA
jgi:hypothetical protein